MKCTSIHTTFVTLDSAIHTIKMAPVQKQNLVNLGESAIQEHRPH